MDTTLLQGYELMAFLYGGIVLGAAYELSAFLRRCLANRWFQHACDFLFVVAFGIVLAASFYIANGGEFRSFGVLGMLAGFFAVRITLGHALRRLKS